jgi:hypothetical protein
VLGQLQARADIRLWAAFGNFRGVRPAAGPLQPDEREAKR